MLTFSTKADILKELEDRVKKSKILPQINFKVKEYYLDKKHIINKIAKKFCDCKVIVRSSAVGEDQQNKSEAGKYLSILNVNGKENIQKAIENVIESFDGNNNEDKVFVQPMLNGVEFSGVIFTIDPNTGGNYYVINYDEKTGSTSSVTSGIGDNLKIKYLFKDHKCRDEKLKPIIDAVQELEFIFGSNMLDVEFAVNEKNEVYLFQVRPLVLNYDIADIKIQKENLERIEKKIQSQRGNKPYLFGSKTIYGIMPDWNPAEIIGIKPKQLALSLYKVLITDGIWAYQRDNYGYKNLRSFPLMIDFYGLPYIDVRVSFNSFLPQKIDSKLCEKLTNYYLNCLEKHPEKHDKVEFDIIFSCYTFDIEERMSVLLENGFSESEIQVIKRSLLDLTNNIINIDDGLWIKDSEKIEILVKHREEILKSDLDNISKIYWLIEDCKRYGTLPFAGLARAGFIAIELLKSMVSVGMLSSEEYQDYMRELHSVTSMMSNDYSKLDKKMFLNKYGHLRPGTYDITSKRYDDNFDLYFGDFNTLSSLDNYNDSEKDFMLSLNKYSDIQNNMMKHGLKGDVLSLFKFIKAGIELREYSKFIFTKNLSDILELLAKVGKENGFSRDDMAFFDVLKINELYSSSYDVKNIISNSVAVGKQKYKDTLAIAMPPVIVNSDDIYYFDMPKCMPNFITLKSVCAKTYSGEFNKESIQGKIILIKAADPGYDWIFSCGITGFITAYGGANSHMAIRACELGIPSVIGCGEKLFDIYSNAKILRIDCANKKIEIIR